MAVTSRLSRVLDPPAHPLQLVNLGKSITDFSAEGDDEANKDDVEQDDDHEQLDEEMGQSTRGLCLVIARTSFMCIPLPPGGEGGVGP